jgi:hypothetical protein
VHNFKFVAIAKTGVGPAIPRHNVAIQFDGDAIGLHAEGFYQSG